MENKENAADEVVSRVVRSVVDLQALIRRRERKAPKACDNLLSLSREERETIIGDGRATLIRSRPVAEELIRRMRKAVFCDPSQAENLGAIAEDLLSCIPASAEAVGGERGWQDLSAHLWAHRANVSRIRCFWRQSHERFQRALYHRALGSQDPLLRAEIYRLMGSLCRDRRHYKQALQCLNKVETTYRRLGHSIAWGKALIQRVSVYREMESYELALSTQLEACKLLKSFEEPELGVIARCNLSLLFCDLGRPKKAAETLRLTAPVLTLFDRGSSVHLNRDWVGSMIAQGLEKYETAEALYRRTRKNYRRRRDPYNEGLVSLDLATLYAQQKRQDKLTAAAEEAYELLSSQGVYSKAEEALRLCRGA